VLSIYIPLYIISGAEKTLGQYLSREGMRALMNRRRNKLVVKLRAS
jgi:hypothetical protein